MIVPSRSTFLIIAFLATTALGLTEKIPAQEPEGVRDKPSKQKIVRVFVLAGQSNMQGQAVVDLDHLEHYNGGRGTLVRVVEESPDRFLMRHLKDEKGQWEKRDDVFAWYRTENELKTGPLTIGFSGYEGKHHFGPELQIGHVLGDAFEEPVLLIKTAWGGKSLNVDFRSPSSGEPGEFYIKMLNQLSEAMESAPAEIPQLAGYKLRVDGFIWQQGWNDMVDAKATESYAANLKNFITDIRKQFQDPDLPFVFGELGNGGNKVSEGMKKFRAAQAEVAAMNIPGVKYVATRDFARPAKESPNQGHGHHWFGNAESYFLIGDVLGRAMTELLIPVDERKRVLILGDSISIGYTPHVRRLLGPAVQVFRPTNQKGGAENCQGTDHGLKRIDAWLEMHGGNWDVIHFNFGLHDLKHIDTKTGKNSMNPKDPFQSSPDEYESQLRTIVEKLVTTKAKLIFCSTTPVPDGVKPARETTAPDEYNKRALKVIREFSTEARPIAVTDLYSYANEILADIQQPKDVHFSRFGSTMLASEVARRIREALED